MGMLVLSRERGENVVIDLEILLSSAASESARGITGESLKTRLIEILDGKTTIVVGMVETQNCNKARIGFEAARIISVNRQEVCEAIVRDREAVCVKPTMTAFEARRFMDDQFEG